MAIFDFLAVRKTLGDFGKQVSDARLKIEQKQREIEDLEFAPAAHEDVVAALRTWAADQAKAYNAHLAKELQRHLTNKPGVLRSPDLVMQELRFGVFLQTPEVAHMSMDAQLCGLLGPDRFAALIGEKLAALDLPTPGLPNVQRAARLAELKAQQAALRKTERDLIDAAKKAGLEVS